MLYNIEELVWDGWNTEHIKKHDVSVVEIGETCCRAIITYEGYKNRLIILGKTKKGRLVTVVLMRKNKEIYYVITARDMSRKERKLINEK